MDIIRFIKLGLLKWLRDWQHSFTYKLYGEATKELQYPRLPIRDRYRVARIRMSIVMALLSMTALCSASALLPFHFGQSRVKAVSLRTGHLDRTHSTSVSVSRWHAPLAQLYVTSPFGLNSRPGGKHHKGTDLRAPRGTAVFAAADGRVVVSSDHYGARYGKVVVIEHADKIRTLYAHLDSRMVRIGENVRAGQQIALSGGTGKVRGPHLHLEVFRQGVHIDPKVVLGDALWPSGFARRSRDRPLRGPT